MGADVWTRNAGADRWNRRRFVTGGAGLSLVAAAAGLVGCSSSNKQSSNAGVKPAVTAAGQSTAATTPAAASAIRATPAASPAAATLDSTKGKSGGTIKYHPGTLPPTFSLLERTGYKMSGLTHSSLLAFRWGVQGVSFADYNLETDLAQAMPEQPDPLTYVYKLRAAKFQNGRAVTSQDVQYSYDRYTNTPKSYYGPQWQGWYDHTETPDPQTVVIKSKVPYADTIEATAGNTDGYILAKEWEEGSEAQNRMMGSGPFIMTDGNLPQTVNYKRNPDYYLPPFPYFDQIQTFAAGEQTITLTQFVSRQLHMPWIVYAVDREQLRKERPDARVEVVAPYNGNGIFMRVDKPPFNDKRVRQAFSMAIDRKAVRDTVVDGEGEPDQFFSIAYQSVFGTHAVKDLGDAAKYWTYDPQAARQLLAAAGVTIPFDSQMGHYNNQSVGQWFPDLCTVIESQWKQLGIANVKDNNQPVIDYSNTTGIGNYDGMGCGLGTGVGGGTNHGINVRNYLYWGPNGEHSPLNVGHINDPDLNQLSQKQIGQLDRGQRQQTFLQMEAIMAEQQYTIVVNTTSQNWFFDPSIQNATMAMDQGSRRYAMKWWFA